MRLNHAVGHNFFQNAFFQLLLYFYFLIFSFFSELCCWYILSLKFYEKKYCCCNLSLRNSKKRKINIILVQLSLDLGHLYYAFGSRVVTDAICKVLNFKFGNLCLFKTVKCLFCHYYFIQILFQPVFQAVNQIFLFDSNSHHLHINPLQSS